MNLAHAKRTVTIIQHLDLPVAITWFLPCIHICFSAALNFFHIHQCLCCHSSHCLTHNCCQKKGKFHHQPNRKEKLQNLDSSKTAKPSFQGMQENTQLWKFLTLDMTSTIQKNLQGNFLSELNPDGLNWTDDDPERIILGLLCRWAAIAVQVDWTQVETKGGGWMCSKGAIIRLLLRVLACSIFRFITLMVGAISIDGYWACFQRTKQL